MTDAEERLVLTRLLLAVPDILLEEKARAFFIRQGIIDPKAVENYFNLKDKFVRNLNKRGKVFESLMALGPEALSNTTINTLETLEYLDKDQVRVLKFAVRTGGLLKRGGKPQDAADIMARVRRLYGRTQAHETVSLLKVMGALNKEQAKFLHNAVEVRDLSAQALKVVKTKKLADMLSLAGSDLFTNRLVDLMKTTGLIDAQTANAMKAARDYGRGLWTVLEGAKKADGLAARMAYTASGAFSHESVRFLKELGLLSPEMERALKWPIRLSTVYNRVMMERMTERRFRVQPNEAPIKTFARQTKQSESALLRLLAESAAEARQNAMLIEGTLRADQLNIQAQALHGTIRQVFEDVGYISIAGEAEVSAAAIESTDTLQKRFLRFAPDLAQEMIRYQSRAGVNSYISRQENTKALSALVYKNIDLYTGQVDKRINMSLLQGKSAEELGREIQQYISPRTPGGISYAAKRLARTEINNAFHQTTIRHTREMPWVQSYKWNLSGSHGDKDDVCNRLANDDHDGLGPGIFKKANVPGKPHPQCLCYITVVDIGQDKFIKNMKAGYYDDYLRSLARTPEGQAGTQAAIADRLAQATGRLAAQAAITAGTGALLRMVETGRLPNPSLQIAKFKKVRERLLFRLNKGGIQVDLDDLDYEITVEDLSALSPEDLAASMVDINDQVAAIRAASRARYGAEGFNMKLEESLDDMEFDTSDPGNAELMRLAKLNNMTASDLRILRDRRYEFGREYQYASDYYGSDNPDRFMEENYANLFADEDKAFGRGYNAQPVQEQLAKTVYTQASYRSMNARLRRVGGDLDAYDDMFPDQGQFYFEELQDGFDGIVDAFGDGDPLRAGDIDAGVRQSMLDAISDDLAHNKKLKTQYGFRPADVEAYYEGVSGLVLEADDRIRSSDLAAGLNKFNGVHSGIIRSLDEAMIPTTKPTFLTRISGNEFFGLDRPLTKDDVGHTFKDDAFVSTEGKPVYFNQTGTNDGGLDASSRQTRMRIYAPEGTHMTRASVFENELLLSRGTRFQVMEVLEMDDPSLPFSQEIWLSIVEQAEDVLPKGKSLNEDDFEELWDNFEF